MQTFLDRFSSQLDLDNLQAQRLPRIAIVGGGAAGVELAFSLSARILNALNEQAPNRLTQLPAGQLCLIHADQALKPGASDGLNRRVQKRLRKRNISVKVDTRVVQVNRRTLRFADGRSTQFDVIVWCTGAAPSPLLGKLGLPLAEDGFLATDATLRSTSGYPVFAVGDCGSFVGKHVPKAGVYAVRQAPVLWTNLERALAGQPLENYEPQSGYLKLLNRGDHRAIGEYHGFSFEGRWVWWLKDAIDRTFVQKYQISEPD